MKPLTRKQGMVISIACCLSIQLAEADTGPYSSRLLKINDYQKAAASVDSSGLTPKCSAAFTKINLLVSSQALIARAEQITWEAHSLGLIRSSDEDPTYYSLSDHDDRLSREFQGAIEDLRAEVPNIEILSPQENKKGSPRPKKARTAQIEMFTYLNSLLTKLDDIFPEIEGCYFRAYCLKGRVGDSGKLSFNVDNTKRSLAILKTDPGIVALMSASDTAELADHLKTGRFGDAAFIIRSYLPLLSKWKYTINEFYMCQRLGLLKPGEEALYFEGPLSLIDKSDPLNLRLRNYEFTLTWYGALADSSEKKIDLQRWARAKALGIGDQEPPTFIGKQ